MESFYRTPRKIAPPSCDGLPDHFFIQQGNERRLEDAANRRYLCLTRKLSALQPEVRLCQGRQGSEVCGHAALREGREFGIPLILLVI